MNAGVVGPTNIQVCDLQNLAHPRTRKMEKAKEDLFFSHESVSLVSWLGLR